jgi:hypothetical protein
MNLKESAIQYLLSRSHNHPVFPNTYVGNWEIDALYFSASRYATFYEIKVSKSDFLADLKKKRHQQLMKKSLSVPMKCKHFIYVIQGFDLTADEVPEYAGLIKIDKNGAMRTIKKAPIIYNEKIEHIDIQYVYKKSALKFLNHRYYLGYLALQEIKGRKKKGSFKEIEKMLRG